MSNAHIKLAQNLGIAIMDDLPHQLLNYLAVDFAPTILGSYNNILGIS